jgi:hypothetical protein
MYRVSRVIALVTFAAMILLPSLIVVLGSLRPMLRSITSHSLFLMPGVWIIIAVY